jgi:hypothetical protein
VDEESQGKRASNHDNQIRLMGAALGFLGATNSAIIGFYLLSAIFNTVLITNFWIHGYLVLLITALTITVLLLGSYWILENRTRARGAKMNLAAGIILASMYIYYAHISEPALLRWLSPTGIALIILPILSGIIARFMLR